MSDYYVNPKSLVNFDEVCQILKMSKSTIYSMLKKKLFPPPCHRPGIKYANKARKFWIYQDVIDFLECMQKGKERHYDANDVKTLPHRPPNEWRRRKASVKL